MNLLDRCPACGEPVTPRELECPLCGEFLRTPDEANVLAQRNTLDNATLDALDPFVASYAAGIDLRGAMLAGADLFHADLAGADLRGADLGRATLSAANLSNADLTAANLMDSDLTQANLCGADLTDANLKRADLNGAQYDAQTVFPYSFDPRRAGAIQKP